MRRAAVSIPSNIAEGHLRNTAKDFKQFFRKEISCSTYNEKTEATMPVVAIDEEKKKTLKIGHLTLYAKLLMDKESLIRQKDRKAFIYLMMIYSGSKSRAPILSARVLLSTGYSNFINREFK